MKILVSGAQGFVGQHLLSYIKTHQEKLLDVDSYDLVNGQDITDRLRLYNTFEQGHYDAVVHLAALTSVKRGELFPHEMIKTNINGTYNIIEMCQKFQTKRLIFFSSSSVLGGNPDSAQGLKEDAPYNPISMYGISKVAGELLVKNSGLEHVIVRPFSVYGENGRQDQVIYRWIHQLKQNQPITYYGDGSTARGYTYVKDLVEATYNLITADWKLWRQCKNKVINLGGEVIVKLSDLKDIFEDYCKEKDIPFNIQTLPIPPADIQYSYADISLAKELLNYKTNNDFAKNVRSILEKNL